MQARGWTLTLCSVALLGMAGLAFFAPAEGLATCDSCSGCSPRWCAWELQPGSTDADEDGVFDTATDGNSDELEINWCFSSGNPIAGFILFEPDGSENVDHDDEEHELTYNPADFQTPCCSGSREIFVSGVLEEPDEHGVLKTEALIGPSPNCTSGKPIKSLTIFEF